MTDPIPHLDTYCDVYAALRRSGGYTVIGGIRALRVLGLSLGQAKSISDAYEVANGGSPLFGIGLPGARS